MRGLILYNGYSDMPSYDHQISRIMEEFEALGVEMTLQPNNVFLAHIEDGVQKVDVDVDFCIFLDKDRYASFMVESCGIRMFNSASSIAACDDKMLTYMALSGHGISMPDSTAARRSGARKSRCRKVSPQASSRSRHSPVSSAAADSGA